METFLVKHEGIRLIAFEIENIYVSRRTIARLLKKVDGVTEIRLRGHFGSSDDIRVEFKYLNCDYMAWEPYGDNSRYWIGPQNPSEGSSDIGVIESVFKSYRPPLHRRVLGDVLTLRLFKRLISRGQTD
jgi:hypothetical protein